MIAADTSTWIAYLQDDGGADTELLDRALNDRRVLMPLPVLAELLSDPKIPQDIAANLLDLPLIELKGGYWERAGLLRARVIAKRRKARLGDALIAQSCIDEGVVLLTRDRDFQAFAQAAALDLMI